MFLKVSAIGLSQVTAPSAQRERSGVRTVNIKAVVTFGFRKKMMGQRGGLGGSMSGSRD